MAFRSFFKAFETREEALAGMTMAAEGASGPVRPSYKGLGGAALTHLNRWLRSERPENALDRARGAISESAMAWNRLPFDDDVPTLGALLAERHGAKWFWLHCIVCHRTPVAVPLAPLVIRWGAHATSNMLRRNFRCAQCGARSTSITRPSWSDIATGVQLFPPEHALQVHAASSCARNALPAL